MKYITCFASVYVSICASCISQSITPQVSPVTNIYVPLGNNEVLARAYPTGKHPFITETPRSYLLLFNVGTNNTIGLLPKFDARRSPTAYVEGKILVVRSGVNISIYRGYVPYETKKRYAVANNTDSGFMVKYEYGDFSVLCELAKTSVFYFSEADIRAEHEAVERYREMRASQFQMNQVANISTERANQQQIQEEAAAREQIILGEHNEGMYYQAANSEFEEPGDRSPSASHILPSNSVPSRHQSESDQLRLLSEEKAYDLEPLYKQATKDLEPYLDRATKQISSCSNMSESEINRQQQIIAESLRPIMEQKAQEMQIEMQDNVNDIVLDMGWEEIPPSAESSGGFSEPDYTYDEY